MLYSTESEKKRRNVEEKSEWEEQCNEKVAFNCTEGDNGEYGREVGSGILGGSLRWSGSGLRLGGGWTWVYC